MTPLVAARVLKHFHELLESAINKDGSDKEVFTRTEIGFAESEVIVATLNSLSQRCIHAYIYPATKMLYIAIRPSFFMDVVTPLLGNVSNCTIAYAEKLGATVSMFDDDTALQTGLE